MNKENGKTEKYSENFETLVNTYQRRLYFYALRILRNHEDAEEAVQDAFMRVHRALSKSDTKRLHYARLSAWLFKITLNVVRNRLRRKRLEQISVDEGSHSALQDRTSPDVILDRHTTIELTERAIRELPPYLLVAARLRFIDGLPHSEIAQRCLQPEGTVKANVFRAKRLLRQILAPAFA